MSDKSSIGDRMKRYESVSKGVLISRMPVIIRLDGKAFHNFTNGFDKPFDAVFMKAMQETMLYLCKNIQGCVLGYTQSDEITLVLVDYTNYNTSAWFDNEIQKMCSVSASMATFAFNRLFASIANDCVSNHRVFDFDASSLNTFLKSTQQKNIYTKAIGKGAMFDSRVFNVPKEDVCNCLIWRQQDATRNSILSVGQAYFSHNELQNKSCNEIQEMLHEQKGINWNDFSVACKRGSCCIKRHIEESNSNSDMVIAKSEWVIDKEIPIFTQDRDYIDKLIFIDDAQ